MPAVLVVQGLVDGEDGLVTLKTFSTTCAVSESLCPVQPARAALSWLLSAAVIHLHVSAAAGRDFHSDRLGRQLS